MSGSLFNDIFLLLVVTFISLLAAVGVVCACWPPGPSIIAVLRDCNLAETLRGGAVSGLSIVAKRWSEDNKRVHSRVGSGQSPSKGSTDLADV